MCFSNVKGITLKGKQEGVPNNTISYIMFIFLFRHAPLKMRERERERERERKYVNQKGTAAIPVETVLMSFFT